MFSSIKSLFNKAPEPQGDIQQEAEQLVMELQNLEEKLAADPRDGETQKTLMLRYNRALSVFAKSPQHRQQVDAVFVKIDELRNTIRRNI
ncbi:hypothetical protein CIG19_15860 [Enterobacterales bacterium CwR94]|nr:hypothetical protein CIG19_15860 [Enterobacterales bacterium CwR94]